MGQSLIGTLVAYAHHHLSRRDALKFGGAAVAASDAAAVASGGVWLSPYGPDDQRGTFNEVASRRTARALRRRRHPIRDEQARQRDDGDFFIAPNGQPVLRDNYRITIDHIDNALHRQRVRRSIGKGDVPILHTGWTHLVRDDPGRHLTQEPGIYLAESRYFADRRVAMVASDTWGLEVLDPAVTEGNAFPCHQELFGNVGVRIGESFVSDSAIADHAYDGVFIATPEIVPGATAGSSAPAFLGQPGRAPR